MSEEDSDHNMTMCCASCGIAEVDELKLKECADCKSVKYCSDACQQEHSHQHEEACVKRAAELRDELLFKQPESSHLGDCPICFIPLPLDRDKLTMYLCCSKVICRGCAYAGALRQAEGMLQHTCPFCRQPVQEGDKLEKQRIKRIEANDPVTLHQEGIRQCKNGDYSSAFEYSTKAAEVGDVEAHFQLAVLYHDGKGVEKDKGKEMYHMEEAAIGGHPTARFNLGCEEEERGNIERAVKHFIISANLGHDGAIKALMAYFKKGKVSKDVLAAALRAHQAAVDATKSPQREAAKMAGI